jgi:hypothetical protein
MSQGPDGVADDDLAGPRCGIGSWVGPASEYARLCHEDRGRGRGAHRRRVLELPMLSVGRWRKRKGIGSVRLQDGTVHTAEIHWYEAHGIGRREFKIKFPLLD